MSLMGYDVEDSSMLCYREQTFFILSRALYNISSEKEACRSGLYVGGLHAAHRHLHSGSKQANALDARWVFSERRRRVVGRQFPRQDGALPATSHLYVHTVGKAYTHQKVLGREPSAFLSFFQAL